MSEILSFAIRLHSVINTMGIDVIFHFVCRSVVPRSPPTCPLTLGKSAAVMVMNQIGSPYLHLIVRIFCFTSTQNAALSQRILFMIA